MHHLTEWIATMALSAQDVVLLEDCLDDWHGLWEVAWMKPQLSVVERSASVSRLVELGLLEVLRITEWSQARDAAPLSSKEALAAVSETAHYAPPANNSSEPFFALSTTDGGEAAVEAWIRQTRA